jgi:predicted restriction endonuclease
MYDLYNYIPLKTEEKEIRVGQALFRQQQIERYGECIVSGKDVMVCDAAHIIPYCECNGANMYDVDNGLLLAKEIHELFDQKLLIINPNTQKVELDQKILNTERMKEFWQYHNKKITLNKKTWDNLRL